MKRKMIDRYSMGTAGMCPPPPRRGNMPRNTAIGSTRLLCMEPSRTAPTAGVPDTPSSSTTSQTPAEVSSGGTLVAASATIQASLHRSVSSVVSGAFVADEVEAGKVDVVSRSFRFRSSSRLRSLSNRSSSSSLNRLSLRSCSSRSRSRSSLRRRSF